MSRFICKCQNFLYFIVYTNADKQKKLAELNQPIIPKKAMQYQQTRQRTQSAQQTQQQ